VAAAEGLPHRAITWQRSLISEDDIREAFQDPAVFCNRSIVPTDPEPVYRFLPSYSDPPQHMKYRQTMNRWFAPAAVTKFSPELQRLARETVAEVSADGATDYLKTFGDHFPVRGFLLSMGLPQDDAEFFVDRARLMSGGTDSPVHGGMEPRLRTGRTRSMAARRPSTPMSTSSPTSRGDDGRHASRT
jgi:cytochrome P450